MTAPKKPRTAAEWIKVRHAKDIKKMPDWEEYYAPQWCLDDLDAFAAYRVRAALEEAANAVKESYEKDRWHNCTMSRVRERVLEILSALIPEGGHDERR